MIFNFIKSVVTWCSILILLANHDPQSLYFKLLTTLIDKTSKTEPGKIIRIDWDAIHYQDIQSLIAQFPKIYRSGPHHKPTNNEYFVIFGNALPTVTTLYGDKSISKMGIAYHHDTQRVNIRAFITSHGARSSLLYDFLIILALVYWYITQF